VHDDGRAGLHAVEHLHLAVQAGLAEAHGREAQVPLSIVHTPVCACTRLTAALGSSTAFAVAGSDKVTSASSPTDRPAGAWSKLTCATRSSVTLSLTASTRATLPANGCPGFDRSTTCAGSPAASPARAALVQAHLDPKRRGLDHAQHRLAGHHRRARFGIAAGHHAVGRRQQAHVRALLAQPGAFGRQALLVLPGCSEVGIGRGDDGVGRCLLLQARFDGAGADEVLRAQFDVAARIDRREFLARQASRRCASAAAMALPARATEASSAAVRSSRSTGSISASNWPAFTRSPTSTATERTRPAASARSGSCAGPRPCRCRTVRGVSRPSAACTTVTRVGASGPERITTKAMAAARPRRRAGSTPAGALRSTRFHETSPRLRR
jgi:hypothetical protein